MDLELKLFSQYILKHIQGIYNVRLLLDQHLYIQGTQGRLKALKALPVIQYNLYILK